MLRILKFFLNNDCSDKLVANSSLRMVQFSWVKHLPQLSVRCYISYSFPEWLFFRWTCCYYLTTGGKVFLNKYLSDELAAYILRLMLKFLAHLSYAQGELLWSLECPSSSFVVVRRRVSTISTIFFSETTGQIWMIFTRNSP